MIVLLDTSTATCYLTLIGADGGRTDYQWEAGRTLARGLLGFLRDKLAARDVDFSDITGIGVMKGPGSFTGLRIGLTVANTIASDQNVPIVGVSMSDDWREVAIKRLLDGQNDQLVMPEYGGSANITAPRK